MQISIYNLIECLYDYTCQLYMKLSFTIISLVVLAATLLPALAQDSNQIPAPNHQTQPTSHQPIPQNKPAQQHTTTTQTHANQQNTPTQTQNENSHPNIVTNDVHSTASVAHQANPSVTTQKPHETQHVAASEHHQSGAQHGQEALTHEHIIKMISEMSQEQLKAFEDNLQGDARKYYSQLLEQNKKQQQVEEAEYQQEYKQIEKELTKSQREYAKQEEEFNNERNKFGSDYISYNEYLFELNEGANQDFRFNIPNAQQVIFNGYTYQNKDGTYSITQDIEEQQPITIIIYENNYRIVYQHAFYFRYFGSFKGNENSSYLIRYINPSTHKLVALNLGVMFDGHHAADKLTVHDVANHSQRVETFIQDVSNKYTDVSMRSVLENENRGVLIKKLDHYYIYSIVEIVLVLVLCVLQVEFIKKLLSTNNVI